MFLVRPIPQKAQNMGTADDVHVIVQGLGSGEGVLIHEDAFANLRLRIDLDQCWIGVSSGTNGDEMHEEERLAACRISSPGLH